jgi:beta-barrel assembly-enhancing protease
MLGGMFLAFLIAAAAPADQGQPLRALAELDVRVATVGDRLARSGLCDGVLSGPGWVLQDVVQYDPGLRDAARAALRLGDAPTVVAVLPGGSAAAAGLRPGDQIEAVGGEVVPAARGKRKAYARLGKVEDAIEDGLRRGQVQVMFQRAGKTGAATLLASPGCPSRFQLLPGRQMNATADGRYVQVSGALVEFVNNDDELALVMAHELAHNILGHRAKLDAAGVSRGLLAGFGKNRSRIRATELEADRHALYLMARAGYDIDVAPAFWERFGRKTDLGILSDGTHAGWRDRVALAEAEIARIRAQQASGQAPTP